MSLALLTAPTSELLTAAEALEHVRELDTSQAGYLDSLSLTARQWVEEYCRRALLTQTWTLKLDAFPADRDFIRLPRPPLQSVTHVKYRDGSGVLTTWASSNYLVDVASLPGRIRLAYGVSWPVTRDEPDAVEIQYVAGYGDAPEDVPEGIRHAVKLLVGHWYQLREPVITGTIVTKVPLSAEALLAPYRALEY